MSELDFEASTTTFTAKNSGVSLTRREKALAEQEHSTWGWVGSVSLTWKESSSRHIA